MGVYFHMRHLSPALFIDCDYMLFLAAMVTSILKHCPMPWNHMEAMWVLCHSSQIINQYKRAWKPQCFVTFTICEVLKSNFFFLQRQKSLSVAIESESTMASNQHRPKARLSLRSNTTVPYGSMSSEQPDSDAPSVQITSISQRRSYIAVAVLCYINLLNYMDRYTIAGEHTIPKPQQVWWFTECH